MTDSLRARDRQSETLEHSPTVGLLEAALWSAPVGFAVLDRDLRYVRVNAHLAAMNGVPVEAHIGRLVREVLPDVAGAVEPMLRQVIDLGEPLRAVEATGAQLGRPDDTSVWQASIFPVRCGPASDGPVLGVGLIITDITERRRAQDRVEASEAELTALVGALSDVILVLDRDGRYLKIASSAAGSLYRPAEDLIGRRLHDVFPRAQADEFLGRVSAALRTGQPVETEYALEIGERTVWFAAVISPMRDDAVVWVARDVSERKRAEEVLRRQALVFETIGDAVLVMDLEGRITDWNPAAERLYGYSRAEMIGRPVVAVHHPDLGGQLEERIQNALGLDGRWAGELPFRRKDGSDGIADVVVVTQRDDAGAPVAWIGVNRDITERVDAERELRRAHATVAALLDASPLATIAVDAAFRVTMWNPAAERLFGWSASDVLGQPLPVVGDEEMAQHLRVRREVQAGRGVSGIEARRRRQDGSLVDVHLYAAPLQDGAGAVSGAVALFVDMSEHRRLEEQLRQSQKMEAVGQLAGGVAHDFNNLLTVIKTYSELLLDQLDETNPLRGDVAEIQRAAGRAASLTRQLLAFSRKQVLQPKVLDLNGVLGGVEPMLSRLIGEDIRVVMRPAGRLGRVRADPGQLEQVLMNLAVNARDAMPHGGTLTIETANAELDADDAGRHSIVVPGAYVMLSVSDTGCGMDAATRSRVFEPFFTTKEVGKGTGLGLSTVYGIVKQSGGYIWVYSEPGQGTTFKIYLPRVDESETRRPGPAAMPETAGGSEVLLLVEDEAAVRTLARRILERQGYTVLEAGDGREALRVAARYAGRIDALVTDMVMPELGGRDAFRALAETRPHLRVLYMSGYTNDDILRRGLLDAGAAFVQKPFSAEALARAVRSVLDARPLPAHPAS